MAVVVGRGREATYDGPIQWSAYPWADDVLPPRRRMTRGVCLFRPFTVTGSPIRAHTYRPVSSEGADFGNGDSANLNCSG